MRYVLLAIILTVMLFLKIARAEEIKASWYSYASLKSEGTWAKGAQRMANGSWYDENALTCACRLYPLGSWLYITNLANGKSVLVRVTDRIGKRFATSRIDLSKRAFKQIADLRTGIIKVKIERSRNETH